MARRPVISATPASQPSQIVQARESLDDLRREWRHLYKSEPPKISRDLLVMGIAYRRQELEHGGLGKTTLRKLQTLAKTLRTTGRVGPSANLALKPGARLIRKWHGRTHTVTITEDGFEYGGTSYPSLTQIARKITGAHWSGPRFFGLQAKSKEQARGGGND
ncbi:DUF2924 domain-containing protein [Pseudorhodoplanes sp.]|jgi:hypothetical protein|uniref:DUF2924 domain-containing protein n=1 Tax=Pseudorhodoplanes sp. TaxID=1934341 RepID=UPI002D0AAFE6|nr:DUF2924 domain-containing protein [Pseudorhodoplanes sp.]HWV55076.1 DUF2924 domain-containing protein [Pseudorhodoplanes sp.]